MNIQYEWLDGLRTWASDNPHVRELWLFGSYAKGTPRPDSDVDIALVLMPNISAAMTYTDSWDEWKDELRAIVDRDVDLEPIGGSGFKYDTIVRTNGILLWRRE